jgi:hypothetical protein
MTKIPLLIACLLVLSTSPSYALRCGGDLILEGDTQSQVLASCGDPTEIVDWVEHRLIRVHYPYSSIFEEIIKPVYVEEWLYNFGPRRFMRKLRFENGHLEGLKTLGYGH